MKTYELKDFVGYKELLEDMVACLNKDVEMADVENASFGKGYIEEIHIDTRFVNSTFQVTVCYDNEEEFKYYDLVKALELKTIIVNEDIHDIIMNYHNELLKVQDQAREKDRLFYEELARKTAENDKIFQERRKADLEAAKQREIKAKLEKRKLNAQIKFNKILSDAKRANLDINSENTVIGWLAKHTTAIHASMPDFLEERFVRDFGADTPRYVVDSKKRTSGGFAYQWAFAARLSVDDLTTCPPIIADKFTATKELHNTAFILNLIYNYGFKFGQEQNAEEIKSHFTPQSLTDFEFGFNS